MRVLGWLVVLAMMWGLGGVEVRAEEGCGAECGPECAHAEATDDADHEEHADGDHPPSSADSGVACDEHEEKDEHAGHDHDDQDEHGDHDEEDDHDEAEDADAHAGHDHAAHADEEVHDEADEEDAHAGHDHSAHAEEDEKGLRLTAEQRERFGIVLATAGQGSLRNEVRLPGEVVFDEDRLVHMVPRVSGIARNVSKSLGDRVAAGDVLAVIDSAELAEAKLGYFAAVTEVSCCQFELPRAQAINDNTLKMLTLLDSTPSVDQLRDALPGEMGVYRSKLITAYAEYIVTKAAYAREKVLVDKKISSKGDFLAAENAFQKAHAEYLGMRDSVAYKVSQNLLEIGREQQLAAFEAHTAEQRLHMLGLSEAEIAALSGVPQHAPTAEAHVCTDPNCKSCKAATEAPAPAEDAPLGLYAIKAPFDGVIVEKHITRGERVGEESDIFTIVDLAQVWVNLTVYTKDLALIAKGQDVVLRSDHSGAQARGTIAMVSPFVEAATRTATARVVLDNSDGRWVPGTFVSAFISTAEENLPVVVPHDAVQSIEGEDVVFIEHEGTFEIVPVKAGRRDRTNVEVLSGLEAGQRYVAGGAFQIKATVITSDLDPHAGHGH